jgi:threonine synthase
VVCTLTGHGLKDPDTAIKLSPEVLHVPANLDEIKSAILERI